MSVLPAVLAAAVLVCASPDPVERVLPIAPLPDMERWTDGYRVEQGGARVEWPGGLPVVEHEGREALCFTLGLVPGGSWQVGLARRGWSHYQLDDYGPAGTLEFDLAGDVPAGMRVGMGDGDTDGAGPDAEVVASVPLAGYLPAGDGWRRVAIPLGDFLEADRRLDLAHMLKLVFTGQGGEGAAILYVADIGFHTLQPEKVYPAVKVNQVGYPPRWHKSARVTPPQPLAGQTAFLVRDAHTGEAAFEGTLRELVLNDPPSGDHVYEADFTPLDRQGEYVVDVPGLGVSAPFRIADDVYDPVTRDVARFWFLQRCGTELLPEHAGPYAHRACHTFDEAIPDPRGGARDCRGGWHDAGDMNRYTAWTLPSVWLLLTLHRHHPERFADGRLGIPEGGNGVPDLLDEVRYEIEWTRKMLIREGDDAGMAYDRIHESGADQPDGVDFYDRRHRLFPTGDEASCAVVANCAQAYLVYGDLPGQREFADACLEDALLAWDYLTSRGRPDVAHLFSAAAVLFDATGRQDAHDVVRRLAGEVLGTWHGHFVWRNYDCGVITYLLSERPEVDEDLRARLRDYFLGYVRASVEAAQQRGYGSPMLEGIVFVWGSNGRLAKIGAHMLMADRIEPDPRCVDVARGVVHWLLGRNPVSTCMVTGYGDPPLGPIYHGMFGPLGPGLPMPPGYLCGGPSPNDAPGLSRYPAKCWRPDHTCWELTECSLGYQAPLTYLLGALTAGAASGTEQPGTRRDGAT